MVKKLFDLPSPVMVDPLPHNWTASCSLSETETSQLLACAVVFNRSGQMFKPFCWTFYNIFSQRVPILQGRRCLRATGTGDSSKVSVGLQVFGESTGHHSPRNSSLQVLESSSFEKVLLISEVYLDESAEHLSNFPPFCINMMRRWFSSLTQTVNVLFELW